MLNQENTLKISPTTKFALLGHGKNLCDFSDLLIRQGFPKPLIITHPREKHQRDFQLLGNTTIYRNVFEYAESNSIELLEADSVNSREVAAFLEDQGAEAGFSFSCRSIIKKELIDFFENRIFNIHPDLPGA